MLNTDGSFDEQQDDLEKYYNVHHSNITDKSKSTTCIRQSSI